VALNGQTTAARNYRIATGASASMVDTEAFEMDDDQERRGRLLHLGKGEAPAHRVARQVRC
jgi:hypothetical protein